MSRQSIPIEFARCGRRLAAVDRERPPLGDKPLLMDPPLPYVYGMQENENPPEWLIKRVDQARAKQPQAWPPGETPWPQRRHCRDRDSLFA